MNNLLDVYLLLSIPFGWAAVSRLQKGFIIFTTIDKYIVYKIMFSLFLGWIVAPFYILWFIFKIFKRSKKESANNN